MSNPQRSYYIKQIFDKINTNAFLQMPHLSDQIFELFCYFSKLEQFVSNGKTPVCESKTNGVFRPNLKPGLTGDHYRLVGVTPSEERNIFLNVKFQGASGILHCPDIVVTKTDRTKRFFEKEIVLTIYECKNYSGKIGPGIYREFIGYCKELGVSINRSDSKQSALTYTFSVMTPCIYTSGIADVEHKDWLRNTYSISVEDLF
ncbi:MAG: hypothetical protein ACFCUE_08530 [Candidatus Bathyarchaeia archaeon]